ncbi:hypothetical protein ABZW30_15230 [Kitasatospora sp. NPDC004669]|uniref:hypothetical protein n=1 Tax=Kitasatospora sp. NPDC004669 TaxID=3154555 RepID=UPI0033BADB2E
MLVLAATACGLDTAGGSGGKAPATGDSSGVRIATVKSVTLGPSVTDSADRTLYKDTAKPSVRNLHRRLRREVAAARLRTALCDHPDVVVLDRIEQAGRTACSGSRTPPNALVRGVPISGVAPAAVAAATTSTHPVATVPGGPVAW